MSWDSSRRAVRLTTPQRSSVAREYWAFTAPQWLADTFQLGVLWIDVVLVGAIASASQAGVYAAVSRLATVGLLGMAAAVLVLGPEFSALLALGELGRTQHLYRRATLWLAIGSVPIFVFLAIFAPTTVRVFGADFESGAPALVILVSGMLISVAVGPSFLTLLMGGQSKLILADSMAVFITNIGLNIVLIPAFGMTGAAISWSASILLASLLSVWQLRRLWRIDCLDINVMIICASAVLCYGIVGFAGTHVGWSDSSTLLVSAVTGTLLYGAVVWGMRARLELTSLLAALHVGGPQH